MAEQAGEPTHTYFVDPEASEEFSRLMRQDRLVTQAMGGPLPEQEDLSQIQRVLDIACGPGGWVLDVASDHPSLEVVGVDISERALSYATLHAQERHLGNASFRRMNILAPLDFPDHHFDLVNTRFLGAVLPRQSWPALIAEGVRVLRPGGILRMTECEINFTTSPALNTFLGYYFQAMKRAGQSFSLDGTQHNITTMLARLLKQAGCRVIGRRAHVIDLSADELAHNGFFEVIVSAAKLARPFLLRQGVATREELDQLCERTLPQEMLADNFTAIWYLLTVWGTTPASAGTH